MKKTIPSLFPFKRAQVVEMMHFADGEKESLLIKVRGRGWFISTGGNSSLRKRGNLTLTRLDAWLAEASDWQRVRVSHFHITGGVK